MKRSEQLIRLMARYGVSTEVALLRAIRDDEADMTGYRMSLSAAAVVMDRMLEAEYQRGESGAYDPPDVVQTVVDGVVIATSRRIDL